MSTNLGTRLDTQEIVRRYQLGESSMTIGAALGCTHRTILSRLRAVGVQPRGQGKVKPCGPRHHHWKGGRSVTADGYVLLSIEGRRVLEHRWVIEQFIGRRLRTNEHVHHVDHNPANNDPSNLVVMSPAEHERYHRAVDKRLRTSCRRGHAFVAPNVLLARARDGSTSRICRICRNASKRNNRAQADAD